MTTPPRAQLTIPSKALAAALMILVIVPIINMVTLIGPVRHNAHRLNEANQRIDQLLDKQNCLALAEVALNEQVNIRSNLLADLISITLFGDEAEAVKVNADLQRQTVRVKAALDIWRAAVKNC